MSFVRAKTGVCQCGWAVWTPTRKERGQCPMPTTSRYARGHVLRTKSQSWRDSTAHKASIAGAPVRKSEGFREARRATAPDLYTKVEVIDPITGQAALVPRHEAMRRSERWAERQREGNARSRPPRLLKHLEEYVELEPTDEQARALKRRLEQALKTGRPKAATVIKELRADRQLWNRIFERTLSDRGREVAASRPEGNRWYDVSRSHINKVVAHLLRAHSGGLAPRAAHLIAPDAKRNGRPLAETSRIPAELQSRRGLIVVLAAVKLLIDHGSTRVQVGERFHWKIDPLNRACRMASWFYKSAVALSSKHRFRREWREATTAGRQWLAAKGMLLVETTLVETQG